MAAGGIRLCRVKGILSSWMACMFSSSSVLYSENFAKVVCLRVSGTAWSLSRSSRSQSSTPATAWRSSCANCPKTTGALTAISSLLISLLLSGLESVFYNYQSPRLNLLQLYTLIPPYQNAPTSLQRPQEYQAALVIYNSHRKTILLNIWIKIFNIFHDRGVSTPTLWHI